jgi:uncharacterized protein YegP (UPF0339 family)
MRFEIKAASGGFRAYIIAANNEILFWSEVYVSKANAQHACELVNQSKLPIYA